MSADLVTMPAPKHASEARLTTRPKKSKRPPLGKLLASSDTNTRETAVNSLLDFLAGFGEGSDVRHDESHTDEENEWDSEKLPKSFREDQMLILWQGCFYCMYMCDKPLPQQKLANQFSEALNLITKNATLESKNAKLRASLSYLSVFWITMVREWPGIDKYRTDKYYLLMRAMLRSTFRFLRTSGWNERAILETSLIYSRPGGPLYLQDTKTPTSIAYHIFDIYLEELEHSLALDQKSDEEVVSPVPLIALLQPFLDVLSATNNKSHFQRVITNIIDPIVDAGQVDTDRISKKRRLEPSQPSFHKIWSGQKKDMKKDILRALFERGANEVTDTINRKRLYAYVIKNGYDGD